MNPRSSYREAAIRGASPVRLVICLYEQAIEDLRRALVALEKKDIESRTRAINHALTVLGQLQGTLDRERGGGVAEHLDRFYRLIRTGIIDAQCRQSAPLVEQQITLLVQVHEAWLEVEGVGGSAPAPARDLQPSLLPTHTETPLGDWNA